MVLLYSLPTAESVYFLPHQMLRTCSFRKDTIISAGTLSSKCSSTEINLKMPCVHQHLDHSLLLQSPIYTLWHDVSTAQNWGKWQSLTSFNSELR